MFDYPKFFPTPDRVSESLLTGSCDLPAGQAPYEVRLQVYPGETGWALRWGLPDYDTDHHGYWGSASFGSLPLTRLLAVSLAIDLLDQASDDYYQGQCDDTWPEAGT